MSVIGSHKITSVSSVVVQNWKTFVSHTLLSGFCHQTLDQLLYYFKSLKDQTRSEATVVDYDLM